MDLYGLIGKPLSHSFSKKYFTEKFDNEGISAKYELFPLETIEELPELIRLNPDLKGLNVTIPYKQSVNPYLSEIDKVARIIGAVNTIKIKRKNGKPYLIGYNTDAIGFEQTLKSILKKEKHPKALILGTGGSANAVRYVLRKHGIFFRSVSRTGLKSEQITYPMITKSTMCFYKLIINTTPLGMYPNISEAPDIMYDTINMNHILIDLIYNPEETLFLQRGKQYGAKTVNGMQMLMSQAEASWKIWNK
ncbi:MAG: shikimate dehydrogenase [Ignavibacteria bacterium]|nr:shikimate dehydrogenase [Ignavibacteria bacterium]